MEFDLKVETKSEILFKYGRGMGPNLAALPNEEVVMITYESLGAEDKPNGLKLLARDKTGNSVSIALNTPKKPWDSGGDPEGFELLKKLFEEKNYAEISKQFFIQKIMQ
ncbi:hypothetical protein [Ferruginibacter profundus]